MSQSLQLESSSSTMAKNRIGDENGKLVVQPSYQCKVCPRVFNKKQAFRKHRFMHLKRERKKSIQSPKTEFEVSNGLNKNKLTNTTKSEVENSGLKNFLVTFQEFNVVKDKLKCETNNQANTSTKSQSADLNRSYACQICDKVFTVKKTFINHKKHHRKKIKSLKLTLTESNFEQVIMDFIQTIRRATDSSKSNANVTFNRSKYDNSFFDLRTVINKVSSNNVEFNSEKAKDSFSSVNAISPKNRTFYDCDKLSQTDKKRIPLIQNIRPYFNVE